MAWDPDLPANTTKIKNAPQIIQDNNNAIQSGDSSFQPRAINLINRQTATPSIPASPLALANTNILYSKTGATTSLAELYSVNPSFTTQLTTGGRVGGTTTGVTTSGIKFGTGTLTNTQSNMVSAWAPCDGTSGGLLTGAVNIASNTRTGTGAYTIVTSAVFSSANVCIQLSCHSSGASRRIINWITKTYAAAQVTITLRIVNEDGAYRDENFDIMILGGI